MAHRGFSLDGLENSLTAFGAAVELGFRHLETDVRASADGVAFAFHDDILDRVTNDSGRISSLPASQVARARIRGREPIPLLEDVLAAFGDCEINIDVKAGSGVGPTLDALRRTQSWHRVRLASFSHRRLQALRAAAGPRVATALSPQEIVELRLSARWPTPRWDGRDRAGSLARVGGMPRQAAQVPSAAGLLTIVDRRFVEDAHHAGVDVHVWTVNRRAQMIRLLDLGVDGIITDRADVLRDVLQERGQWNR
jgi:glycerophosphoryl diester phosphodiesterase